MKPIRIALGILLATVMAGPSWAQEQSAAPATPPATHADQLPLAQPPQRALRIRVSGDVAQRSLIHMVQPVYPGDAKAAHVSGTVIVHVIIGYDGAVQTVDVVSGPEELKQVAADAVKQWKYRPTLLNGQPVQVDSTVTVLFHIDRHGNLKPQPKNP